MMRAPPQEGGVPRLPTGGRERVIAQRTGSAGLRGGPAITPSVCRKSRDVEKICPLPGAISMYNLLHVLCLGLDSPCERGTPHVGRGRKRGLCTGDP